MLRRIAVDAATHEIGNESHVTDRFRTTIDEELRVKCVVDEAIGFTRLDSRANFLLRIATLRQARPELRFGQPAFCK